MTVFVRITVGELIPEDTWDDAGITWDDTGFQWDSAGVSSPQFRDFISAQLIKNIGENNSTSRLTLTFDNFDGIKKTEFTAGDIIELRADKDINPPNTKIFSGTIVETKFVGRGSNEEKLIVVARDWTNFLQKGTIEPTVFTNTEVSVIVTSLIDSFAPSDFTTNNVNVTGRIQSRIAFNQVSLFDALKELSNLTNFFFYVDEDKDVHFEQKGTTSSGETLDNTNTNKAEFRTDVESVKNRVYVYGTRQQVKAPQESFTADGAGSVFTLSDSPHDTQVTSDGVEQVGAVFLNAESVESGANYLVNFDDKQIIFVSGTDIGYSSIPGSLDVVDVDFNVSRPIVKLAEDPTSIQTYGARAKSIVDKNITDPQTARDVAKNQVQLNKDPSVQGVLSLHGIVALTPGDSVVVNLPNQNQSNKTYDILEANYDFTSDKMQKDKVLTVRVSKRITDLTDVLQQLLTDVASLNAGEIDNTAILSRLFIGAGSFGLKASSWKISTRTIGNANIVGHPTNGVVGSGIDGFGGGVVVVGSDARTSLVVAASGGE